MLTTNELLHKKGENIRRMFSSIAHRYDFLNALLSLTFDRRWRRFAVSVSGLQEGDKVLDVCTGTGDLAIEYAKAVKSQESGVRSQESTPSLSPPSQGGDKGRVGLRAQDSRLMTHDSYVVGTDFCEEMLRLAIPKIRNNKWHRHLACGRIKFVEADTLRLPFPDGSFQVSTVAFGIRNVADLEMGIKEMTRVISPGGRVVILEFAEPENKVFRWLYDFYFHKILPIIGRLISASKIDAYTYLPSSVQTFPNRWQLKAVMESCGLEDVKIYPRTFGIVNVHVGKKPYHEHRSR